MAWAPQLECRSRGDAGIGREQRLHFVAEAQATSQLEHPGIPPVHDIGLTADGRPYFTMKLVRGRTLREVLHDLVLRRRQIQREYSLHRLVTILERIAEALQFAHERGVVHRDIKPENVMLGDYGEVHLMDWGLAHIEAGSTEYEQVETARTASGLETQYGTLKGTLPGSSHVLRGGSWGSSLAYLRCTYRHTNEPRYRRSYVGFRCAGGL